MHAVVSNMLKEVDFNTVSIQLVCYILQMLNSLFTVSLCSLNAGNIIRHTQTTRYEHYFVIATIILDCFAFPVLEFQLLTICTVGLYIGNHFGTDLMHRKVEVKAIITEVINNMSDDEDDDEVESGDDEA